MPDRFEWVPDIRRGKWLRPVEAEPFGSILSVVPRGFQAYARVFHPVERDRPHDTKTWQGIDERTYFDDVNDIAAALETERTTWANVASSFGTTMHSEAQYAQLVRRDHGNANVAIAADGWRYAAPLEGCIDAASLAAASAVLARHTRTPDAGIAAVWEGWGGLVSSAAVAYLAIETSDGQPARYTDEAPARIDDPSLRMHFAAAAQLGITRARSLIGSLPLFGQGDPESGFGLLAREVAATKRFDLHGSTGRHYVLFEVGANDCADIAWPGRAPWVDEPMWAQSPNVLWPDDHAWVLAAEIDFDSTLIAGTTKLIKELMQTPGLEVLAIRTDADLTRAGDRLNRTE